MEEFRIYCGGREAFDPIPDFVPRAFDIQYLRHTPDTSNRLRWTRNYSRAAYSIEETVGDRSVLFDAVSPNAHAAAIAYREKCGDRGEAVRAISRDREMCWLNWQHTADGWMSIDLYNGTYTMTEPVARTLAVQQLSCCLEGRIHTEEEEDRMSDAIALGMFRPGTEEQTRQGRVPCGFCHSASGASGISDLESGLSLAREWAPWGSNDGLRDATLWIRPAVDNTYNLKFDVTAKKNPPSRCYPCIMTENSMREWLAAVYVEMALHVPPGHPVAKKHGYNRERAISLLDKKMLRGGGPLWARVYDILAPLSNLPPLPSKQHVRTRALEDIMTVLRESALFAALAQDGADLDVRMTAYMSMLFILQSIPGTKMRDFAFFTTDLSPGPPVGHCVHSGHDQGANRQFHQIRKKLTRRVPNIKGAADDLLKELQLLVRDWDQGRLVQPIEDLLPLEIGTAISRHILGVWCFGLAEVTSVFVPLREPRKCYFCVIFYPEGLPFDGVRHAIKRRIRGAEAWCRGILYVQLADVLDDNFTIKTEGDVRARIYPYGLGPCRGVSISAKVSGYRREMGDFTGKLLYADQY
ncbi:outer capsid protein [Wad Medani virus]|uniref:Outer capsid protein n=1 Tax=Wad Medani virus TaxID=40067 RepID=A0A0H4M3R0_9REOV|nr:outer capsid protein [Wad Medani virus]AKP24076.1 outer capsid protein [Wad Medani virus]